jgi:hypothetical protein
VDELSERILRVRLDLAAIEELLSGSLSRNYPKIHESDTPLEGIKSLKLQVDQMRSFLWAYKRSVEQADQKAAKSFFDEVQSMATLAVERHMNPPHQ